ncbi:hypothetical protein HDU76_002920 [Blyttiomyces sp. JEL0837]|nr:hypothetical protein HDU76_002920 [Blyttiomyces sp. JEL0837]
MVTAPRLIGSSAITGANSTFLSVAECKMKVTHYAMANHDTISFVNLIKQFVCFSILQGNFATSKYEILFRNVNLREYANDSALGLKNIQRCFHSFIPNLDSSDLVLLQNLNQSYLNLDIFIEDTNPLEKLLPLSQFKDSLRTLEIIGRIDGYEGLDHLTGLSHLSIFNNDNIIDCMDRSNIRLSRLANLSYLDLNDDGLNMDDFLTINAMLPSLKSFSIINLDNKPYDLLVSQARQKTIPSNCNLQRIQLLRVSIHVLSSVSFAALIDAMISVFTGVKKLIVHVNIFKAPSIYDRDLLLDRLQQSKNLAELVFHLNDDVQNDEARSMDDDETNCDAESGIAAFERCFGNRFEKCGIVVKCYAAQ